MVLYGIELFGTFSLIIGFFFMLGFKIEAGSS